MKFAQAGLALFGVCVPSTCDKDDVVEGLWAISEEAQAGTNMSWYFAVTSCMADGDTVDLDGWDIFFM